MPSSTFDRFVTSLETAADRRSVVRTLGVAGLIGAAPALAAADPVAARRRCERRCKDRCENRDNPRRCRSKCRDRRCDRDDRAAPDA